MRIRLVQIMAISVLLLFYLSYALADNYTHGSYTLSTNACANCHIFHRAPAFDLLRVGPTQTQLCYLCHGNGATASPYDVQGGLIFGMEESSAGGFDTVAGSVYSVTSRHLVTAYVYNNASFNQDPPVPGNTWIPGSDNVLVGSGLVCSSCHDPHAGGPDAPNPRLLRMVILDVYAPVIVTETPVGPLDEVTGYQATQITGYVSGFTNWCSSCHNLLAAETGSGHTADSLGLFRHAMDVPAVIEESRNTTVGKGIPLEGSVTVEGESTGNVTCMTCHRSHGTAADMSELAAVFARYSGAEAEPEPVISSALLRLNNRDVCFNCHGPAERNQPYTALPELQGTIRVVAIDYTTYGGRNSDRHLTVTISLADDFGVPVPDAAVTIELYYEGTLFSTGTRTTGLDGKASFSFNNVPGAGLYTTLVIAVDAGDLEWDENTPEDNSFNK